MLRKTLFALGILIIVGLAVIGNYWIRTQPILVVHAKPDSILFQTLPVTNQRIVNYIEANGTSLAPDYNKVVCTEFVIQVLQQFSALTKDERTQIRIITDDKLIDLVDRDADVIKGVQQAIVGHAKGIAINSMNDVKPGDFVQFWNYFARLR
jgi:hypothetical protein